MRLALPEVLFLDVGDTLIRAHPSWAGVYRQGLLESGIDIAEQDLERALLEETQSGGWWLDETPFEPSEAKSFETVMAFDAAVLARLGHGDLEADTFRRIEDAFARRSAWYVFPDVNPALDALNAAGIRLCVISNFVWGLPELIHDLELARHFEKLVVSALDTDAGVRAAVFLAQGMGAICLRLAQHPDSHLHADRYVEAAALLDKFFPLPADGRARALTRRGTGERVSGLPSVELAARGISSRDAVERRIAALACGGPR